MITQLHILTELTVAWLQWSYKDWYFVKLISRCAHYRHLGNLEIIMGKIIPTMQSCFVSYSMSCPGIGFKIYRCITFRILKVLWLSKEMDSYMSILLSIPKLWPYLQFSSPPWSAWSSIAQLSIRGNLVHTRYAQIGGAPLSGSKFNLGKFHSVWLASFKTNVVVLRRCSTYADKRATYGTYTNLASSPQGNQSL